MALYDVVIIGAGFTGLTLTYQLLQNIDNIRIALINDKTFPVPDTAHKVGESLNEVGGLYLSHILKLHDYMEENHFRKMGMRFFMEKDHSFFEMGINDFPPNNSFHFERGVFENNIYDSVKDKVNIFNNHKFIDFHKDKNYYKKVLLLDEKGENKTITSRWVIDCSGMKKTLARKFNITHALPLSHSSVWIRLNGIVNVNDIYPVDKKGDFIEDNRIRSSTHIEGRGYWVWILLLSEENTSLGITFDEKTFDFNNLSSKEKMFQWLKEHTPLLGEYLYQKNYDALDFKFLRKFSTISEYATSEDRWALSGDAYGFWEPYYSSGFDLSGFQNSLITHNIKHDLMGHDIKEKIFNNNKFIFSFMKIMEYMFIDMFDLKGDWYYLSVKYCLDSITYFSSFCLIMRNVDFSDDTLMAEINEILSEIVETYGQISTLLKRKDFNKNKFTAPKNFFLQSSLFSLLNLKINEPNGNKQNLIKALKKNLNLIKYEHYYIRNHYNYIDLLSSSVYNLISDTTPIEQYMHNPLSLFETSS